MRRSGRRSAACSVVLDQLHPPATDVLLNGGHEKVLRLRRRPVRRARQAVRQHRAVVADGPIQLLLRTPNGSREPRRKASRLIAPSEPQPRSSCPDIRSVDARWLALRPGRANEVFLTLQESPGARQDGGGRCFTARTLDLNSLPESLSLRFIETGCSRHPRHVRGTGDKIRTRGNPMSVYKSRTANILLP